MVLRITSSSWGIHFLMLEIINTFHQIVIFLLFTSPMAGPISLFSPTGRYSDGRLAPDFIASKLNLPFMPPILKPGADFTHGANFASAGATATLNVTNTMIFGKQVQLFKELVVNWTNTHGIDEAKRRIGNAVYLISIGGNDYFNRSYSDYSNDTIPEQQEYVDTVIETIFKDVQDLYSQPLISSPQLGTGSKIPQHMFYSAFVSTTFSHLTVTRVFHVTNEGFKYGDVACCGIGPYRGSGCGNITQPYELCFNPSEYVYFDGSHTTEAVYSQLADIMWSGGPEVLSLSLSYLFEVEVEVEVKAKAKPLVWGPFDDSEL
ncbi:hypothetical protein Patl1_33634 [Pistacia atlantica]|uniref:Uncharacterized protein n=1 Tax=Pistacia atlantica TaxID=434234 RepID=A0ACC0ZU90_9ROSI|nr:hypothetical protein Patl1_33634 [Pistacia atlantica]